MVKIRLRRMGAKKAPYYRIVVADSHFPRDGRFIEEIGTYNPLAEPSEVKVDAERAQAWIKNGAQPTDTVKNLLKKAGVIDAGFHGRLTLELRNDGPHKVRIPVGSRVVQIYLMRLDGIPAHLYGERQSKYMDAETVECAK